MSRRVRAFLLAAGLAVIVLLVAQAGPALLLEMFVRVGWNVVTVAALYAVHVVLRAVALWRVGLVPSVSFADVLRIRLAGEAVEVLTYTGPFLAEPAKGWLLTRRGMPTAEAFASVAAEYLLYTTASAALAFAAFCLLMTHAFLPASLRPGALVIAPAVAGFIVAVFYAAFSGVGLIVPIVQMSRAILGRSRAARAAEIIEPVERALVAFLHERPARVAEVLAIETAGQVLLMAEIWIVLVALGAPFAARDAVIIEGGVKLISVVFFFIPGQVGATEAVYAFLLRAIGLSTSIGLTLVFVRRVRSFCVAGVGLLALSWVRDPP